MDCGFTGIIICRCRALLALKNYPGNWMLTPTTLFWFPLLLAYFLCFAAYSGIQHFIQVDENDEYDEYDYGLLKKGLILFLLIISCMISVKTFFATALLWGIIFLLYEEPLRLVKVPVLRNVLGGMAMLAASFVGFGTFGAPMIGFPGVWMLVIFTGSFAAGFIIRKLNQPV